MVRHIVFFRLLEEAEGKIKQENAQIIKERLENLLNLVSYLRRCEVGVNIPRADNTDFDLALTCELDSWDDLRRYAVNPDHQAVLTYIKKCISARSAVDYEV